jgi:hypothetical protein
MTRDMSIILGGVLMPAFGKLDKLHEPNESDNVTLGGTLFTHFVNRRRGWILSWDHLKTEDVETIVAVYESQYVTGVYPILQFDAEGVYAPVKIEIYPAGIRWNGSLYEGFKVTLKEKYSIS